MVPGKLIGTHRNGQFDHMPPAYRSRLPAVQERYLALTRFDPVSLFPTPANQASVF
jgi:hypothetical protein